MSYLHQTFYKTDGAFLAYGEERLRGLKNMDGLTTVGSMQMIDITAFESRAMERTTGKADPGTITTTANAAFQTPLYDLLEENARDNIVETLTVVFGNVPSGAGVTDGTYFPLRTRTLGTGEGIRKATAGDVSAGLARSTSHLILALTDNTATRYLPGISRGDFFNFGDNTKTYKIERIHTGTLSSTNMVSFEVSSTDSPSGALSPVPAVGDSYNFRKPAVLFTIEVLVSDFNFNAPNDGVAEGTITFQITGEPTKTVGGLSTDIASIQLPTVL